MATRIAAIGRENLRAARRRWGGLIGPTTIAGLRAISTNYALRVSAGEVILLDGQWYVTHTGLLTVARRRGCTGILTQPVSRFCDPAVSRWTFKAIVYTQTECRGFVGYGDAGPSNVSDLVRGAELRIAETRAVNRALRKAYGIGLCSVEELGAYSGPPRTPAGQKERPVPAAELVVINGNGQPRLRDRLAQLIRQHRLDSELVKLYAADFCGTQTLREASRELIEDFINSLAEWARTDRDGLLCKLNSYAVGEKESAA